MIEKAFRNEESSDAYWSAYLVSAWQGEILQDDDGDLEPQFGFTESTTSGFQKIGLLPSKTTGAFVYAEAVREGRAGEIADGSPELASVPLPFTVAHELGHTFQILDGVGEPSTLMNPSEIDRFQTSP